MVMIQEAVDLRGKQIVIHDIQTFQIVPPPETHEVKVNSFRSSPVVWAELIRSHPEIERLFFSHYPEHPPTYGYTTPLQGVPSDYSMSEIIWTLENGLWPKSKHGEICAISPTVGVRSASGKLDLFAFPTFDLDQQPIGTAVFDIIDSSRLVHADWSLLNTGNGLHVITNDLVRLESLPLYLAGMIRMFVRTPDTREGRLAYLFADTLHTNAYRPDAIRQVCKRTLSEQPEYPRPFVDINNCALMLLEAMDALKTPGPAGFFRISNKPSRGEKPPYLIAEQVNRVVYKYVGTN